MSINTLDISITIPDSQVINLKIVSANAYSTLVFDKPDARENGEAEIQIVEGGTYEYKITEGYCLECSEIVSQSKISASSGRIEPNIYVGTISIYILEHETNTKVGNIKLEVQSIKINYRDDYRIMLHELTEWCTELLLRHSSPSAHLFEIDFLGDAKTLYQRFAFIKSILDSAEFNESIHKILTSPTTRWKENKTLSDIRNIKRINSATSRQIITKSNRIDGPPEYLHGDFIQSVPSKIEIKSGKETLDTPENRFVKHSLTTYHSFCGAIKNTIKDGSRLKLEASLLENKLEELLNHSIFKDINSATSIPLNSPTLQRKEGYREILKIWLMFDLASKIVWHGGDNVYSGNKRDVAVLYEYWMFLKLLKIIEGLCAVSTLSIESLIETTTDGLGLKLKQGQYIPIAGVIDTGIRKLNIELSYNKTFKGKSKYPASGSWTRDLRPDYTLSIWPLEINKHQAEIEELIIHIHFDAKYRIDSIRNIFEDDEPHDEHSTKSSRATYKRDDLLKMHTYRDAIRRTAGSYVLYPGENSETVNGFHELLPGLGAFAIRPSKADSGVLELTKFLKECIKHFENRASQREKMSLKTFEIYKNSYPSMLNKAIPEAYGTNRNSLPDETYVLIGFYHGEDHLKWILKNNLYNTRINSAQGSIRLNANITGVRYLLLHTKEESNSGRIYKLSAAGPRIFSKHEMLSKSYPNPSQEFYLVFEIVNGVEKEFSGLIWNVRKIPGFSDGRNRAIPFPVSLTEFMKAT